MSLTVKILLETLKHMNPEAIIRNEQNQDFVQVLASNEVRLSTTKPIGICNRSGGYVYPSIVEGYVGFCPELDEDLYEFEFSRDMSEMRE